LAVGKGAVWTGAGPGKKFYVGYDLVDTLILDLFLFTILCETTEHCERS